MKNHLLTSMLFNCRLFVFSRDMIHDISFEMDTIAWRVVELTD